ncbi:hypothetical protein B0H14DRAFT_2397257, partial [Mycena olivaceomarginata]
VHNVLLADDFDREALRDFDAAREAKRLDVPDNELDSPFSAAAGWKQSSVSIPLPCAGVTFASEADAPRATVGGIFHRDIVEVATSAFQDTAFFDYHMKGYKLMWKPSEDEAPQRVYGETYKYLRCLLGDGRGDLSQQPVDDPPVETFVVPLMYYSDGTQLAAFGSASLWPGYAWVGNQSKYTRDRPTTFSTHHFAYYSKVFVLLCSILYANKRFS